MHRIALFTAVLIAGGIAAGLVAQTPAPAAKPAAAAQKKAAAPKPATLSVDKVVEMKKAGLGDDMILKQVAKLTKGLDLSPDDMLKLKGASVPDSIINALMDPKLATAPAAAAPPPPAPAAPAPAPVAVPAPVAAPPAPAVPQINEANKRRVLALNEFEWATVKTAAQEVFKTNTDIGKGIRAMLTTRLQQAGRVRIVERAGLQKVMG